MKMIDSSWSVKCIKFQGVKTQHKKEIYIYIFIYIYTMLSEKSSVIWNIMKKSSTNIDI